MKHETDDYMADMEFGAWLRDQRVCAGFSLEEACQKASISPQRLKSLEMGLSERGINQQESEKLCGIYRIVLRDLIARASR
jgi:hypothetical protein